jgi:RNA polymerase sigma-70 factor (ECF subfamily)
MADEPGGGGEAASLDEVRAAVEAITADELERLEGVGGRLAFGIRGFDGKDIMMDALERALRGSSTWRRGVPFSLFLYGVMKNVAKQRRELKSSSARTVHVVGHGQKNEREVNLASADPDPEQAGLQVEAEAEARETVGRIRDLFKDDVEIEAVIYGIENDIPASEVQDQFGMTATQYASARKRMKRTLTKEFPRRA